MKAILIEDGKPKIVEGTDKYLIDFSKRFLGSDITIERVYLSSNRTLVMCVDEDGLSKELPLNFFMEMDNPFYPIQAIVGKVIIVRVDELDYSKGEIWDYEVTDVTDEDIAKIDRLLDEDYLVELALKFHKKNLY